MGFYSIVSVEVLRRRSAASSQAPWKSVTCSACPLCPPAHRLPCPFLVSPLPARISQFLSSRVCFSEQDGRNPAHEGLQHERPKNVPGWPGGELRGSPAASSATRKWRLQPKNKYAWASRTASRLPASVGARSPASTIGRGAASAANAMTRMFRWSPGTGRVGRRVQ
jgi:hypothetical protein